MSYRSIKRILGESSLERKIRILFTVSILILIGGSFLWVNRITEEQIRANMRDKALELSSSFLLRKHLASKQVSLAEAADVGQSKVFADLAKEFRQTTNYRGDSLVLPDQNSRFHLESKPVSESFEIGIVSGLTNEIRELQKQANQIGDAAPTPSDTDEQAAGETGAVDATQVLDSIVGKHTESRYIGNDYAFYVPILFKRDCISCHYTVFANSADQTSFDERLANTPAGEATDRLEFERRQQAPMVVLRITLPHQEAKSAINRSRAILITVAIVTAALSTIALYLIVRYVIVKPLRHLRDVADEVGKGRMDIRAELNTGDEFEELSWSFNRMLRHLLDTQVKLQNVNRDLDNKVDEQAQLNLKLHEMNQLKSEFLANMSHELRTPLNSIIGFSEILENAPALADKQKRFATNIRKSGRLLLELINDILDLAKLEAGKMEVNPGEFSIYQLAVQLCEMVRPLAETKRIQLVLNVDESLPPLYQDMIKVRQILTNLLSNAIKFTPEGGRIQLSAKRDEEKGTLVLAVADTGVGIAESEREIIFEKFRQGPSAIGADTLTREISGTGLGLSIVSEICILLGGRIELESEVGKGSVFTVTLPWTYKVLPRINSALAQTINELTKPERVPFTRSEEIANLPAPEREASTEDSSAGDEPESDATRVDNQAVVPDADPSSLSKPINQQQQES